MGNNWGILHFKSRRRLWNKFLVGSLLISNIRYFFLRKEDNNSIPVEWSQRDTSNDVRYLLLFQSGNPQLSRKTVELALPQASSFRVHQSPLRVSVSVSFTKREMKRTRLEVSRRLHPRTAWGLNKLTTGETKTELFSFPRWASASRSAC